MKPPLQEPRLQWIEAIPGQMPEDLLPHTKYRLWEQDREATEFVLVCREHREQPDCSKRVRYDGASWAWTCGDGITRITHWARYNRAVPWDSRAHREYLRELHDAMRNNHHK